MDANQPNYYRILQVQPDAPVEVIRHNYIVLFQKMRMHPDLGGNNNNAAMINVAYETLRHPEKRAAYDQLLLKQHNILIHTRHPLSPPWSYSEKPARSVLRIKEKNQRNYYRIFQVHPDAHATVIRERYTTLLKNSEVPRNLLDEAFMVLNNSQKRIEYDRLLRRYKHSVAIAMMQKKNDQSNLAKGSRSNPCALAEPRNQEESQSNCEWLQHMADVSCGKIVSKTFRPLITRYCEFCKTPHTSDPNNSYQLLCGVCKSPLFFSGPEKNRSVRSLERLERSQNISFYTEWPGRKLSGHLLDISPRGLCFKTEYSLDIGQIIKIDGEKFKAVAEVIHGRAESNISSNGVCFLSVLFESPKGNFLLTSV